jgi:hypothetical protein
LPLPLQAIGIMQSGTHAGGLPHPDSHLRETGDTNKGTVEQAALSCPKNRPAVGSAPSLVPDAAPLETLADGGMQNVLATWLPAAGLSAHDERSLLQQPGLLLRPSSPPRASPREVSTRSRMPGSGHAASRAEQPPPPWQPAKLPNGLRSEAATVSSVRWSPSGGPVVIDVRDQLRSSLPAPFVRMRLPGQRDAEVVPILGQQYFASPVLKGDNIVRTSAEKPAWKT